MKRSPLRARSRVDRSDEPGYWAWKAPVFGSCAACAAHGLLLRHHVVLEQHVRAEGGDPWDLANSLLLGYYACSCHRDHHHAVRRLPRSKLPPAAIAFVTELLGPARRDDYLRRFYSAD